MKTTNLTGAMSSPLQGQGGGCGCIVVYAGLGAGWGLRYPVPISLQSLTDRKGNVYSGMITCPGSKTQIYSFPIWTFFPTFSLIHVFSPEGLGSRVPGPHREYACECMCVWQCKCMCECMSVYVSEAGMTMCILGASLSEISKIFEISGILFESFVMIGCLW